LTAQFVTEKTAVKFESNLVKGTLKQRFKRFLADVVLENGSEITAHCPNTGSMKSCYEPGATVYLSHSSAPTRKYQYTWEYTKVPTGYIGVNTARPNLIVEEGIRTGKIPELAGYKSMRREVKYGVNSRIDILLEGTEESDTAKCWVEVKNTTLLDDGMVKFPDAVTSRGQKHLNDLVDQVRQGDRAVMFYLVNRPDGKGFAIAKDIDPDYWEAAQLARSEGVEFLAYRTDATLHGMSLGTKVAIEI
jgi:sugar fermentation stimulation protein A